VLRAISLAAVTSLVWSPFPKPASIALARTACRTDYRLALEDLESTRSIDLLITDIVMPERVNGVA
jgi:hypothetical protein